MIVNDKLPLPKTPMAGITFSNAILCRTLLIINKTILFVFRCDNILKKIYKVLWCSLLLYSGVFPRFW